MHIAGGGGGGGGPAAARGGAPAPAEPGAPPPPPPLLPGTIEALGAAGVAAASQDLVISNCVLNLSADKGAVLAGVAAALKEGGEMYFSGGVGRGGGWDGGDGGGGEVAGCRYRCTHRLQHSLGINQPMWLGRGHQQGGMCFVVVVVVVVSLQLHLLP
jgi:hypothetical protein